VLTYLLISFSNLDLEQADMGRAIQTRKSSSPGTAEHAAPKKHRMRAAERRQHLIVVALRLFASHGFRGTTTKSIAEAAGNSEAVIFRHFKMKEDLYAAIVREKARQDGYDEMMEIVQRYAVQDEDERVIFHLILKTLESFQRDSDFHRLMLYAALEKHDIARVSRRIFGLPLFEFLRTYVLRRQKAGVFRKGDPYLLAFSIMAIPLHFAMVTQIFGVKRVNGSNRSLAEAFTQIVLAGLYSPESRA